MGHFWTQNQHFEICSKSGFYIFFFFEIYLIAGISKAGQSDSLEFLRKIDSFSKNGG